MITYELHTTTGINNPISLAADRILCNNIVLPGESHPHGMRLWVIGNEFGALGAVWANHERDAFDELVDSGLGNGLLIDEKDADEDCARLGNAGEPANLDYAWLYEVTFDKARDSALLMRFAEARDACADTLDQGIDGFCHSADILL